jgi:preprotein translocase subunit SecE
MGRQNRAAEVVRVETMFKKIANFFQDVKIELGKVTWSTRDELIASTTVVILSVLLLAMFIGMCDFILLRLINFVIKT